MDRNWFNALIGEHITKVFDFDWTKESFPNFLFGDYAHVNKEYVKIDDPDTLLNKFNDYLMLYNSMHPKNMNLVFFKDAIMHLSRICRCLRAPRGNSLLIGVGGSGR